MNALNIPANCCAPVNDSPQWKRVLDVACIALSLPVTIPLCLLIAFVIKFGSPGPVLFRQERIGFRGKPFICYKFRTMKTGADHACHREHMEQLTRTNVPMTKLDSGDDSRVLRVGKFLRRSGLDELPQLLNVLKKEMSLVGPRPCVLYEYDAYLPWQRERFNSLPGLTGLWQVSGKNKTTFARMVELDIEYTRTMSPWTDLRIILKTIPALASQVKETRAARAAAASLA
jgi:exopolysaccharide production protein ExoY